MELESNLNEISSSWNSNFTRKKLAFIGTGFLVATALCISVIVGVKSSSNNLSNNGRDNELIPGTFDPTNGLCAVPYGEKANDHREFDLLVTKNPAQLVWEEESNGGLRNGAVSGGHTAYDKELYVARFSNSGYKVLGELYPARKAAAGPVGRAETYRQAYQLLCFADFAI